MTIQPVYTGKCPSTSKKTALHYEVGLDTGQQPHFRITKNEGGGFFSDEWVAWNDIQGALKKVATVTSAPLHPLFKGKSVNTPAFLLAVLAHEQLVRPHKDKQRHYQLVDSTSFLTRVSKGADPKSTPPAPKKAKTRPKTGTSKPPRKK
jgi:hypothetical protein